MFTDQLIGHTISHFQILELIGMGGMGAVYKARDIRLDTIRALKFLHPQVTDPSVARIGLSREARTQGQLLHPNIATLMSLESCDLGDFLVMEYVDGPSLDQYLSQADPPLEERIRFILEIAAALAAAHLHRIIHRDIKPTNVLVTPGGSAKVTDFGLARVIEQTTISTTMTTGGTAPYMPPEAFRGETYSINSDIWALGILAYEIVESRRPFQGSSFEALGYQILNSDPEPVSSEVCMTIPGFDEWISTCLQKHPKERHADGATALSRLLAITDRSGLKTNYSSPPLPVRTSSIMRGRRAQKIAAAVLILLIGIAGIIHATRYRTLGFGDYTWEEYEGSGIRSPVWDSDGVRLAYLTGEDSSVLQIIDTLAPTSTANTFSLPTQAGFLCLGWRPKSNDLGLVDRTGGLFLFNVENQSFFPLQIGNVDEFSWSQNGQFIVYSRQDSLRNQLEIIGPFPSNGDSLSIPLSSRSIRIGALGQTGPPANYTSPVYIHGDKYIAFTAMDGPSCLGVYRIASDAVDGSEPIELIPKENSPYRFRWNEGEKRLVFKPIESDSLFSVRISKKGYRISRITQELNLEGLGEWDYFPAGGRLVAKVHPFFMQIFSVQIGDNNQLSVVFDEEGQQCSPAYSTAQQKVYFWQVSPYEGVRILSYDKSTTLPETVVQSDFRYKRLWCPVPDPISEDFLVFSAEALGIGGLFFRNLNSGSMNVLHSIEYEKYFLRHPFWTRDGQAIYFIVQDRFRTEPDRVFQLNLSRQGNSLISNGAEEVFSSERIRSPTVDNSDRFLLFQQSDASTDSLFVYDRLSETKRFIVCGTHPALDPTGEILYYHSQFAIYRILDWTTFDPEHQSPEEVLQLPEQTLEIGTGGGNALAVGDEFIFVELTIAGEDRLVWSHPPN
ncbi:protein kinase [Candidatus Zixiibacteriota bacterium]